MFRMLSAVLGTLLLLARVCILGGLGLATLLCAGYTLYWFVRHGGLPDLSLAGLHPGAYEYLLPPHCIVLNTVYLYCLRLPLVAFLGTLLALALLLDRLVQAVVRWMEAALRAEKTI